MSQCACRCSVSVAYQTPDSNRGFFWDLRRDAGVRRSDGSEAKGCDHNKDVKVSSLPEKSLSCSIGKRHVGRVSSWGNSVAEVLSENPRFCDDAKVEKTGVEFRKQMEEVFGSSSDDLSYWAAKVREEVLDSGNNEAKRTQPPFAWNREDDLHSDLTTDEGPIVVAAYASQLRHCGNAKALDNGKRVHADIISRGYEHNKFLGNLLVEMYGNCGSVMDARSAFTKLSYPNLYSWTLLIKGYAQNRKEKQALEVFGDMQAGGVKADKIAFISILGACASLTALTDGWNFHSRIVCCGFDSDAAIGNALINMYSKCGSLDGARNVFTKIEPRNLISWTTMIAALVQNGQSEDSFQCFKQMQAGGVKPDKVTFISILNACASLAAQEEGHEVHAKILDRGLESDVIVGNALINMYGKCGNLDSAKTVFDKMHRRNVISWTALIAVCAQHGHGSDAFELFSQMKAEGIMPDEITYIGVLTACSHMGLVDVGKWYFASMQNDYGLAPLVEHYVCMIDLFGRAGRLGEAEELLKNMPFDCSAPAWLSLLSVCRIHGDVERGARAADNAFKLDPANASPFSHLLNIHAAAGRWDDFEEVRRARTESGMRKEEPQCSSFDVEKRAQQYLADDKLCIGKRPQVQC